MSHLLKEQKLGFFKKFGGDEKNTGSVPAQIALLTERMNYINEHRQGAPKDFSSHTGLMQLVGRRKRLLTYFKKHNLEAYRKLIEELNIRK